jgi:membrane protease subunit HflK
VIKIKFDQPNGQFEAPNVPKGALVGAVVAAVAAAGLWTAYYSVEAEEEAIVLRFGKVVGTVSPGLHFKLPFGIDRVKKVAVRRQLNQVFGFVDREASSIRQVGQSELEQEKQMVTGDLNAAMVEWVIQYRIDNPIEYLFNVRNADETLRDASESVTREVVGDRTVDEVITVGRQEIGAEVFSRLQELVNKYEMGLSIDQVQLKNVNPPREVQASFNEVNQAQQEREKAINVANGEYNKKIPEARGIAEQVVSEAEGYATERINEAEGDAAKFNALFAEFVKAEEVTKRRIYLETLQEVMPKLGSKIIIDEETAQVLPLLQLGREAAK